MKTKTKYLAEAPLQPQFFLVWCNKLCSAAFGNDLLFFSSPLLLSSSVRCTFSGFSRNIWLGSSSGCGWATQGHSQSCLQATLAVFRVTVLLEGKPSAQSEVLNALDWVFMKAISIYFGALTFSSTLTSPCSWKTAPQHEAATSTLYFWDVLCMWWAVPAFLQT